MNKIRLLKKLILVNLFWLILFSLYPAETVVRVEPASYILKYSVFKDVLNTEEYIKLSLLISGTKEDEMDALTLKFQQIAEDIKVNVPDTMAPKERAEKLLSYIHENFLTGGYIEKQTTIDVLLKNGSFNCVSSAVFYMILGKSIGLDIKGVKTKDHAFCIVLTPEGDFDVETTNAYGFDPGKKKEFTDSFGHTGYSYVPPGNYKERPTIEPYSLMSLIIQNRITFLSDKKLYLETCGLAFDQYYLVNDQETFDLLIVSITNISAYYNNSKKYQDGIGFLDKAVEKIGPNEKIIKSQNDLLNNLLVDLIGREDMEKAALIIEQRTAKGNFSPDSLKEFSVIIALKQVEMESRKSLEKAYTLIKKALSDYGNDKRILQSRDTVANNWVVSLFKSKEIDRAFEIANILKENKDITESKWKDFMVYIFQERAVVYSQSDTLKAAAIIKTGMELTGSDKRLIQHYDAYIYNYEVDIHNKMVGFYNAGQYTKAFDLLTAALKNMPDNKRLLSDLDIVKKALNKS